MDIEQVVDHQVTIGIALHSSFTGGAGGQTFYLAMGRSVPFFQLFSWMFLGVSFYVPPSGFTLGAYLGVRRIWVVWVETSWSPHVPAPLAMITKNGLHWHTNHPLVLGITKNIALKLLTVNLPFSILLNSKVDMEGDVMLAQMITALGPNDPDDGDVGRRNRGIAIAAMTKIEHTRIGYKVPSQSGKGSYIVSLDDEPYCSCPDFELRQKACKHIYAVEYTIRRETNPDGSTTVTETVKVTRTSTIDWHIYNEAQTHEQERFTELLQSLCEGIKNPPRTGAGRPRLPMADVVYSLASRAYSMKSGRRHDSEVREAQANGIIEKAPSYNSAFRYLENPELTPLLKSLIEESAKPLKSVEVDFAVDSSGFATNTYSRWYDHKWGKMRSEAKWVKAHLICGVNTHVVSSIEITPTESADAPFLTPLVEATAKNFSINEVSGDKAYSSRKNLRAVENVGGTAYIPFKSNTNGVGRKFDGLWNRMWHYYNFNREQFLEHYHKRSNVETAYSMIKMKFGGSVRAKTPVAQVNEALCKVLCHNICVLIQSIYELGLEPVFWNNFEAKQAVAPKQFSFQGF